MYLQLQLLMNASYFSNDQLSCQVLVAFFLGLGQGRVGKGWWKRRKEGKEGGITLSLFVGYENAIWCAADEFIATDLEIS